MKKALKAKWLKALRSGKYQQGAGALYAGGEFCCLGVLADIQGCKWAENGVPVKAGKSVGYLGVKDNCYLLPRFAGLSEETQKRLARMNDRGATFAAIADEIEKSVRASA